MVAIQPKTSPSGRYSVNETCQLLGIHRNTLRRYTEQGDIVCGYRGNMKKFYTGLEIVRFWRNAL